MTKKEDGLSNFTLATITPRAPGREALWPLHQRWLQHQTRQPDQVIVVGGGDRTPGPQDLARNVLEAIPQIQTDVVAILEDDDYYGPSYLGDGLQACEVGITGAAITRLYRLQTRGWCLMHWYLGTSTPAPLGSVFVHRRWLPALRLAAEAVLRKPTAALDGALWGLIPREHWRLRPRVAMVGIKGVAHGITAVHRTINPTWPIDADGSQLRAWIGDDAAAYRALAEHSSLERMALWT